MCRVLGDLIQEGCVTKLADDLYCGGDSPETLLSNWRPVLAVYKLLHEMTTKMCEYFAMKDVVHKQMNEIVVANPTLRKFAEMLSNPDKGSNNELLAIVSDIINNNGKKKNRKAMVCQHQDSFCANYGLWWASFSESSSGNDGRSFLNNIIQNCLVAMCYPTKSRVAFVLAGIRIYGIAKDDVIVLTAEDIIKIAGDKSLPKTKLVKAFVLAPVYTGVRKPFEWVWDSKFRKFFLDKYTKGNEQNNGLTLDYDGRF